jgi:hypothetical protein
MRHSLLLLIALSAVIGCAKPSERPSSMPSTKELAFLTRDGCVQTDTMRARLDDALKAAGLPTDYQVVDLDALPTSDVRRGYPTPTLLYANADVFGMPTPTPPLPEPT